MSTNRPLLEPILNEDIRHAHWFNGRLLSAEALQADQMAQRRSREQLGRAIGSGIASGLNVSNNTTNNAPRLDIKAGLAVNPLGQTLELREDITLQLSVQATPAATSAGLFSPCQSATSNFVRDGFFLLAIAPTSGYQERVPVHDIRDSGIATSCGSRYETAGVMLRLVEIDIDNELLVASAVKEEMRSYIRDRRPSARSQLRSLMAHWCLGTFDSADSIANLYTQLGVNTPIGLEARLRQPNINLLQACDVPLALFYWTERGVHFVDNWSVRRPITSSSTNTDLYQRDAVFQQFQSQLAEIPSLVRREAKDYFYRLPAAGLIPIGRGLANLEHFFTGNKTQGPFVIDGAKVHQTLQNSFHYPPIRLQSDELIWLYVVRQNQQKNNSQRYILFTTGHMPFVGDAHYNVARWDYAHYGSVVLGE